MINAPFMRKKKKCMPQVVYYEQYGKWKLL